MKLRGGRASVIVHGVSSRWRAAWGPRQLAEGTPEDGQKEFSEDEEDLTSRKPPRPLRAAEPA
jgi:hypothetical protein